jgi:hypothetical protein
VISGYWVRLFAVKTALSGNLLWQARVRQADRRRTLARLRDLARLSGDLGNVYVRADDGSLVALSGLIRTELVGRGAERLRVELLPAVTIN